jgi:3'-phosphoadenosine 5'-phosphosulfate sulfotransferase (PAPS reductase)/FAD synthetase
MSPNTVLQHTLWPQYEELELAEHPRAASLGDLDSYDRIIVCTSGGKDSAACVLYLLDIGIPKDQIVLWHQDIDGGAPFMDWPVTEPYVRAFGEAMGMHTEFQWREDGFWGEMMRENSLTNDVRFEHNGKVITLPTRGGKHSTRRKFPAKTASLRTRWCTAYLKIDVMRRVLNNHPDYQKGNYLVITGERREESANRAKYLNVEEHPCNRKGRQVTWWRTVIEWPEEQVWEIIEKHRILPHPAYWLGFSRTSCFGCIFCTADQWATMREVSPERFDRLVEMEQELDHTIDNTLTLTELANRGTSRVPDNMDTEKWIRIALDGDIQASDIITDNWELPAGAFTGAAGGPV